MGMSFDSRLSRVWSEEFGEEFQDIQFKGKVSGLIRFSVGNAMVLPGRPTRGFGETSLSCANLESAK